MRNVQRNMRFTGFMVKNGMKTATFYGRFATYSFKKWELERVDSLFGCFMNRESDKEVV